MLQKLSSILLCILFLTFISTTTTFAAAPQDNSFYILFKNSLINYIATQQASKQVLAAQTIATSPIPSPTLQPTPQPLQQAPQLSDVSTYIINGVNEYRASFGLAPVQATAETCAFAATRAQEIANGFNHNGFYDRVNNHTIPYAQWAHATENIAEAPDYKEVVSLWAKSPDHAANMRDNTPYVCIMQSGPYYAYEGMRL